MKTLKPYIEMFVLIAILYALGFWLRPEDPFFNRIHPSPYLIIVLIGAIKYASPFGLILGIICAGLDLITSTTFAGTSLRDAIYFEPIVLLAPCAYIAVGHFVGEAVHSSMKRNEYSRNLAEERKKLVDTLTGKVTSIEGRYRQLEGKVAAESKSSYSFLKSLIKFDDLEPQMISDYTVEISEKYLKAREVEYWIKGKDGWQRESPEAGDSVKVPALLLKAETLDGWANCRDYPKIAGEDGVDLALCRRSIRVNQTHAIVCKDIPFIEWGLQLEDTAFAILRGATKAYDFWNLRFALGEVAPLEQMLRLESLRLFKNQVHRQLLTLRRSDSVSTLVFIKVETALAKDIRVLGVIASCFRSLLRLSDGMSYVQEGAFFVLFLPQTPIVGAEVVLKKVNTALETLHLTPHQKIIKLQSRYFELTTADMLERAFEEYGKGA